MVLPAFVIVGTMKGGTSALVRGVKNHPDVFTPGGKEMHFFDRHFEEGLDWYRSRFAEAEPGAVVGEATPDYMYGEEVVERMTSSLPDSRFMAILRNPVDRAYSHYWHNVRRRREDRSFEDAIAAEIAEGPSSRHFAYLDRGRYVEQLRAIEQRSARDRMLVISNDDLRIRRGETLRTAWAFVGADPDRGRVEEAKRPLRWHLRNRLSSARRERNEDYPPMDPALREKLIADALPGIEALERWWGRDLSSWKS